MDPLDPNTSFLAQFTEPDPAYFAANVPVASTSQPLFASQHSNYIVDQLVAPADYLQNQRAGLAQRINSVRLDNTFAPPSAQGYPPYVPAVQAGPSSDPSYPQSLIHRTTMDKRHPSSFQQLEKVRRPCGCQWLYAKTPTAGRRYLCHRMSSSLRNVLLDFL